MDLALWILLVLRFYAIWDDTDSLFGECRHYIIHYYLMDDTVEIREVHERNNGRDPFPLLMNRQRMPKVLVENAKNFPKCVLEISDQEVLEWYTAKDFIVGKPLTILGRTFFIYDCDPFTRQFYKDKFGMPDLPPVDVTKKEPPPVKQKQVFGHRFVILDTDEYVLKYMESNASQYSPEALASIQNRIQKPELPAPELESKQATGEPMVQGTEESKVQDLDALIDQIHMHLKYNSCKENLRETFQMYDKDESGYVDRETFFKICETLNVPVDDSLIKELIRLCTHGEGRINYYNFVRAFSN